MLSSTRALTTVYCDEITECTLPGNPRKSAPPPYASARWGSWQAHVRIWAPFGRGEEGAGHVLMLETR